MNKDEIKSNTRHFTASHAYAKSFPTTLRIRHDSILDALADLKLASYLEDAFAVKVEAHNLDVDHHGKLNTIADMLTSKRAYPRMRTGARLHIKGQRQSTRK